MYACAYSMALCVYLAHYFMVSLTLSTPCSLGGITIPNDVTFTLISDLNGASPQFTLTCISTGGPATTVTWTRDSVTVAEGNGNVLDNPETAQYTHTLTVTGRLGGLYTCTVANAISSVDSAIFTVRGTCIYRLHYTHEAG